MLDTSVIVSSFRSTRGASRRLIDLFDLQRFELLLSPALLLEYEDVLSRFEQMDVHGFTISEVSQVLDTLAKRATPISVWYQWRPQLRDPADELVLELAINGNAHAIVTHNLRDFLPEAASFGIEVLTPGRIIRERLTQ